MNLIQNGRDAVEISLLGFAAVAITRVLLSIYYRYSRPTNPDPTHGRIHEYHIAQHTVFLTRRELNTVGSGLVPFAIFFWLVGLILAFIYRGNKY